MSVEAGTALFESVCLKRTKPTVVCSGSEDFHLHHVILTLAFCHLPLSSGNDVCLFLQELLIKEELVQLKDHSGLPQLQPALDFFSVMSTHSLLSAILLCICNSVIAARSNGQNYEFP